MKAVDMRKLTDEELKARVHEARDHLFNLRIKHATGQLENTASLKTTRGELARALTVQREGARAQ